MKLLFDENLSPSLVEAVTEDFPGSSAIELLGMRGQTDSHIWDVAKKNDFAIVSKDSDFRQRAFRFGPPPKVIWLSIGNAGTKDVANLLRLRADRIRSFLDHPEESVLILEGRKSAV